MNNGELDDQYGSEIGGVESCQFEYDYGGIEIQEEHISLREGEETCMKDGGLVTIHWKDTMEVDIILKLIHLGV